MRIVQLEGGRKAVLNDHGRLEHYLDPQGNFEPVNTILPGDERRELAQKLDETRHSIKWDAARTAADDPRFADARQIIINNLPPAEVERVATDPDYFAKVYPRARQMAGPSVAELKASEARQARIREIEEDMAARAESRHGASLHIDELAELMELRQEEKNGNG